MGTLEKCEEKLRKLFVAALDSNTTEDSLRDYYQQFGDIDQITLIRDPKTQKSRRFGFVTFMSPETVDIAMSNRPHRIDGKDVDSKRSVPKEQSGFPPIGAKWNAKKLFIGGLKEQPEDELRDYFGTFGKIIGLTVVSDKDTGKRKGYAFIEYDDFDPVDKALLKSTHEVGGQTVTVKKAMVKVRGPNGFGNGNVGGLWARGDVRPWNGGDYFNRPNMMGGSMGPIRSSSASYLQNQRNQPYTTWANKSF